MYKNGCIHLRYTVTLDKVEHLLSIYPTRKVTMFECTIDNEPWTSLSVEQFNQFLVKHGVVYLELLSNPGIKQSLWKYLFKDIHHVSCNITNLNLIKTYRNTTTKILSVKVEYSLRRLIDGLTCFTAVQEVHIHINGIVTDFMTPLFSSFQKLTIHCNMTNLPIEPFLIGFPSLQHLDIIGGRAVSFKVNTSHMVTVLKQLMNIKTIHISCEKAYPSPLLCFMTHSLPSYVEDMSLVFDLPEIDFDCIREIQKINEEHQLKFQFTPNNSIVGRGKRDIIQIIHGKT
jgi:RNase P/RNase MRP subunit POP5